MGQKFLPCIGITAQGGAIEAAVIAAGGIPVFYEQHEDVETWLEFCHGFVIPGGLDVNPILYNAKEHKATSCDPQMRRDLWERYVIRYAMAKNRPLLGICRGHQMINVACGGKLIQHIDGHWGGTHQIEIVSDLWKQKTGIAKTRYSVNSIHHQAVHPQYLGDGLEVAAVTGTGIVEAVVSTIHRYVVGIQSHPEMSYRHVPQSIGLFEGLVRAATPRRILAERQRRAKARIVPEQDRVLSQAIDTYCFECGKRFKYVKRSSLYTFLCRDCGLHRWSTTEEHKQRKYATTKQYLLGKPIAVSKAKIELSKIEQELEAGLCEALETDG